MNKLDDSYEMLDDSVEPVKRKAGIVLILVLVLLSGVMATWVFWHHFKIIPSVPTMANKTENNQPVPVNTTSPDPSPSPLQVAKPAETTINFDYNSADINAAQLAKIKVFYDQIASTSGKIEVSGYTDNLGAKEQGQILSLQRAEAVASDLKSLGANSNYQYTVQGLGDVRPIGSNATEEGRQQNRRVEIRFTPNP